MAGGRGSLRPLVSRWFASVFLHQVDRFERWRIGDTLGKSLHKRPVGDDRFLVIEWRDRGLFKTDCLGLFIKFHLHGWIEFDQGLVEQRIDLRIAVATMIRKVERRFGSQSPANLIVRFTRRPAIVVELELPISLGQGFRDDREFLLDEGDVEAYGLEDGLKVRGHQRIRPTVQVLAGWVEEQLNRNALSAGGLVEKRGCFVDIPPNLLLGIIIEPAFVCLEDDALGGDAIAIEEVVHERIAVDSEVQRLTNSDVVEWLSRAVEDEERVACGRK